MLYIFDLETLGKKSDSVILSCAAIYFDPDERPSPQQMRDEAFFAKFDVRDQHKRLKRSMGTSTMDWWKKQCQNVKVASFIPHEYDMKFEDGYELMRQWAESKNNPKCWVWARGNLDQLVLDDIEEQCGLKPIWPFNRWRDVRTAVDFLYDSADGYVDVDYPGFDARNDITKHNPVDDCLLDAMQLLYGVKKT
jgi:3' exoribonuclease, RNase T-like